MKARIKTTSSSGDIVKTIFRLYRFTQKYLKYGILGLIGGIIGAGLHVMSSYLYGRLAFITLSGELSIMVKYSITLAGVIVVSSIISYVNELAKTHYSIFSGNELLVKGIEKIHNLPIAYYENRHSGDTITKLMNDIEKIKDFYGNSMTGIWGRIPATLVFSIFILFKTNVKLTIICGTVIPLFIYVMNKISIPISEYTNKRQEAVTGLNSYLRDFISGIHLYKSNDMNKTHGKKAEEYCDNYAVASTKIAARKTTSHSLMLIGMIVPQIIALSIGTIFVINGSMTFGELFVFYSVMWPFVNTLRQITDGWSNIIETSGYANHFFSLIDELPERTDGIESLRVGSNEIIKFTNTGFSYNEMNTILESVSFCINKNESVAIVGASGSGKSTIFKMIAGYYENYTGEIIIMEKELSDWNLQALRSFISEVSQEVFLFNDSIIENIRYGNPNCSDSKVKDAAIKAYANDFILELENGYETILNERGMNLSGGQRQRIAIARAILKESEIILMDEPTSALDNKAGFFVCEALRNLAEDKTILTIAHRLTTIENADKIFVLDEGHIIACGTHKELIESCEKYTLLYKHQINDKGGI